MSVVSRLGIVGVKMWCARRGVLEACHRNEFRDGPFAGEGDLAGEMNRFCIVYTYVGYSRDRRARKSQGRSVRIGCTTTAAASVQPAHTAGAP